MTTKPVLLEADGAGRLADLLAELMGALAEAMVHRGLQEVLIVASPLLGLSHAVNQLGEIANGERLKVGDLEPGQPPPARRVQES